MDFALDQELTLVRDMARDFAEKELFPRAARHDRQEHLDREVLEKIGELGLFGLTVPEEYGGSGLGNLALAIVLIELNRACASTGVTVSVHNSLVGAPLRRFGSKEQQQAWFPRLATGEVLGAYCLTEPSAGSDAASLRTTARLQGGEYVLDLASHCSPASLRIMKRQVYQHLTTSLEHAGREAIQLMLQSFDRPDFREGVMSFLEKRNPRFARV